MSFIDNEHKTLISIIVRVDNIVSEPIPERSDPEYLCRLGQDILYDITVQCSGIQGAKDDTIPVILTFSLGLNDRESSELKRVYEIGKIVKVQGEYHIVKPDNDLPFRIEIDHPVAYPLPKIIIRLYEDIMGETYLPQWTMESDYQINVWLDDVRPMPKGYHLHVKTAKEAIETLKECNGVKGISLDHDLGDDENGTGYDVACFIEQSAYNGTLQPLEVSIHSANPVGRSRMEQVLERARCFWMKREQGEGK